MLVNILTDGTFITIMCHLAMKPEKIEEYLVGINQHAALLLDCYTKHSVESVPRYQKPIITVSKLVYLT